MFLTVDELIDGGMILEIDPMAISSRVLMKGSEGGQVSGSFGQEFNFGTALLSAREHIFKSVGN